MRKYEEVVETSGELVDKVVKEVEVPQKVIPIPRQPPPFPQRLVKKANYGKYRRFITMLKYLSINVPLIEALEKMPGYAKFMKDTVTKKRSVSFEDDDQMKHCSAIAKWSLVQKKKDTGAFTIPCTISLLHFGKALCDLSARINLLPLSIYKKLGLGDRETTAMQLLMADQIVKRPIGRPFLATGRALVDIIKGKMKFMLNDEEETFNIFRSMKQNGEFQTVSVLS